MNKLAYYALTIGVLFVNHLTDAQTIQHIDTYGVRTIGHERLHDALGIRVGDPLDVDRRAAASRLEAIDGISEAVVIAMFVPGDEILLVGIQEDSAPTLDLRAPPTGDVVLPEAMVKALDTADALTNAIVGKRFLGEEVVGGSSFSDEPDIADQERIVAKLALANPERVQQVLRDAADPHQRAMAAKAMSYLDDKRFVAAELSRAFTDSDTGVRNSAIRALSILAGWANSQADLKLEIDAAPLIVLLESIQWTDRNKAAALLDSMTYSRDKSLLDALRATSIPALAEMARWHSVGHASFSVNTLGRLAGLTEDEISEGTSAARKEGDKTFDAWITALEERSVSLADSDAPTRVTASRETTSDQGDAVESFRTVKAESEIASISEGAMLHADSWVISPEVDVDVFVTNPFEGSQQVVFMTDIDSLTLDVVPDKIYEFDVLLNGETARTQINTFASETPSMLRREAANVRRLDAEASGPARIPFTLGTDSRIYVQGRVNGSKPIKLLFDSGASSNVISTSLIGNTVSLQFDREVENQGVDGVDRVALSEGNQLVVSGLAWDNLSFLSIDYRGETLDGILGWRAFENKVVEINYDERALFIHESVDAIDSIDTDYSKHEMKFLRGIPYIRADIATSDDEHAGWFGFDTGSDWSLSLSRKFATDVAFIDHLPKIGSQTVSGSSGVVHTRDILRAPEVRLGDQVLSRVPISVFIRDPEGVSHNDTMGNLILKRFNALLDFKSHRIYLAPNELMAAPYFSN